MLAPMRRAARRALQTTTASVFRNTSKSARCQLSAASSSQVLLAQRLPAISSRAFSTADDAANAAAPPQGLTPDAAEENRFLELADTALHDIMSWLDGVEEMLEESDISLAVRVHVPFIPLCLLPVLTSCCVCLCDSLHAFTSKEC